MVKKNRTNLGAIKGQVNRKRARRVNGEDKTLIPSDPETTLLCAKCSRPGRYILIHRDVEYWFCMEHYFSY